jgi:hypothetical protein
MVSCVVAFTFAPRNKLNLIWLIAFRVPIIGTISRIITLGFAQLFFIGIGAWPMSKASLTENEPESCCIN